MGRRTAKVVVYASLSDHNSERDEQDAKLLAELGEKIRAIAEDPRYAQILDWVSVEQ